MHFQDTEEKYHLKQKIHDKKGSIGHTHGVSEDDKGVQDSDQFNVNKMNIYLDNLVAAATQEKNVLD